MDPFDQQLIDLGRSLIELFLIMRGKSHGIFQGSQEAALFEAQAGQIGPGGFDHLDDVRKTAAAIQTRQDAVNLALNRLQGIDSALGGRLRAICQPVLRQSGEYLNAAAGTERAAISLRQTDPTRFQGVIIGEGGLGPEIGRTSRALVTNQLNQMSQQLIRRGIEPRLIPTARQSLQPVMVAIRQLPIDAREAIAKLSAALTAMRVILSVAAQQALLAGRAALTAALLAIEQALISIGSRLTAPPIIIPKSVLQEILRQLGLSEPDEA
jgi:hypothetical protein